MADQDFIRIGTVVDVSGLQSGMAQAVQVNKAGLDQLKADYAAAATEVKQAAERLADGQVQLGRAAAAGNEQAVAVIKQLETKLGSDAAEQARLSAAVKGTSSALLEESAAATAAAASVSRSFSGSYQNARLLGAELMNSPYGVVRGLAITAAQSETLGPILRAAFPVIGAVALAEVLYDVSTKAYELYQNFVKLKGVEEEVQQVEERLGNATVAAWEKTQRLAAEHLKNIGEYAKAAQMDVATLQSTPINLGEFLKTEDIDKKLKQLPDGMREELKRTFTSILPSDIDALSARLKAGVSSANAEIAKLSAASKVESAAGGEYGPSGALVSGVLDERGINQQKNYAELYSGLLQMLQQKQDEFKNQTVVAGDSVKGAYRQQANAAIDAANEAAQAVRQKESDLRQADQNALTDLRLADRQKGDTEHEYVADKLVMLALQLSGEMAYGDRVREIRSEIAASQDEYANKQREALEKAAAATQEQVKKEAEYQEKLREIAKDSEKIWQSIVAAEAKATADQARARATGQEESRVGGLESQKVDVEATRTLGAPKISLNPFSGGEAELAQQQERALDEAVLKARMDLAKQLADIDKQVADITGSEEAQNKYREDLNKLLQLQQQYGLQVKQDQIKTLQETEAGYKQYFNTITNDFQSAVDKWIRTGKGFPAAMQNMGADLVVQMANHFIQIGLKWAETWALNRIIALTGMANIVTAQTASQTAQAATEAAAKATAAAEAAAINFSQVEGLAAVAGAAAFASTAAIPIVGPALAPAAGDAAFAVVMATYAPVSTFEGGGIVPNSTTPAMLHPKEMVLPARYAEPFVNAVDHGGFGGSANPNINITQHNTLSGSNDAEFKRQLKKHAKHAARAAYAGTRMANRV